MYAKIREAVVADAENIVYEALNMAIYYVRYNDNENRVIPTKFVMRDSILRGGNTLDEINYFQYKIRPDTDFDTFAKQTFLYIYNPKVNNANKDKIYRAYLFFILEVEKLYRNEKFGKELLTSMAQSFNKLFEVDERFEIDIGKFTILMESIKEAIYENTTSKTKKNLIVVISAYVYRRLASILSLRESDDDYHLKKIQHEIYRISADMIVFDEVNEKNYASIISNFNKIGIDHTFLYLFKEPIKHNYDDIFVPGEFLYLKAMQIDGVVSSPSDREQMIPISELFEYSFSKMKDPGHLVMLNLYVRDMIYGVLICDIPYRVFSYYESLIYQVSCAIRILHLLMYTQENNIKLDNLAKKDELTGIYNRRGFFSESDSLLANEEEKKKYVVVGFADTDNLKTINDTYGHDEGDLIITESSRILTDTLDSRGVIARLGGDEFAFMFFSDRDDEDKVFFKDFEKRVQDYNEKVDKPYTLSISLGMNVYEYSENIDLKELLDSADKEMYHIKKKRRNRQ